MRLIPYDPGTKTPGMISYGQSSYGYDIRLGYNFAVYRCPGTEIEHEFLVDPTKFDDRCLRKFSGDHCIIPANGYVLAETMETFRIPEDCLGIVIAKSTQARAGIMLNVTPLEPGWRGVLTLEIKNLLQYPVKIYAGQGIGQLMLHKGRPCCVPYNKKPNPSYQDQTGVTPPKVMG